MDRWWFYFLFEDAEIKNNRTRFISDAQEMEAVILED